MMDGDIVRFPLCAQRSWTSLSLIVLSPYPRVLAKRLTQPAFEGIARARQRSSRQGLAPSVRLLGKFGTASNHTQKSPPVNTSKTGRNPIHVQTQVADALRDDRATRG